MHNLKNIDLDIPKNKLVVITGLSGSGKSSLAFDTLYAEAERRFVESLSSYARQFLGVKDKPDVESIDGLSPAISIDQKSVSKNPRSTVGTITEIYDYLRILFARIGHPHCPSCGKPVGRQTVDQIVSAIVALPAGGEIVILAPLIRGKKGEHRGILEEVKRNGFLRVRINGEVVMLEDALAASLDKKKKHSIEVVVDRFRAGDEDVERVRIRESVETALKIGKGVSMVAFANSTQIMANEPRIDTSLTYSSSHSRRKEKEEIIRDKFGNIRDKISEIMFSENFACVSCGISFPPIEPRTFSFNSPYGACPACTGLGSTLEVDPELVLPNKKLSIAEGAIRPWMSASHRLGRQSWYWWILDDLSTRYEFSLDTPVGNLSQEISTIVLHGENYGSRTSIAGKSDEGTFEGVIPNLKRRWKETDSDFTRAEIEKYMIIKVCSECEGKRLRKEALAVKIGEENIASLADLTVERAQKFFRTLLNVKSYETRSRKIYETWSHKMALAGNEQKIATPLVKEIIKRLEFLSDVGLEYLTISRESTTLSGGEAQRIQLATQIGSRLTGIMYILDEPSIGLHPRDHSRLVVTLKSLRDLGNTVIVVEHDPETMRQADWIVDLGPGAGKHGGKVMFAGTPAQLLRTDTLTGKYLSGKKRVTIQHIESGIKNYELGEGKKKYLIIKGASEHNLKTIDVKIPLSPIGRTPRSNPATYTGAFGFIRDVFAKTIEARARGYAPGRFSFNVKGGRCELCEGQGVKKIEMYFLPDVYVECEECGGKRYNREALEIEYNGKNIAEVLDMPIEDARDFFGSIPGIQSKFKTLYDVGLGYMKVGQPAPTLSGGEAQRVKLATELSRRDTGKTLYILDEPTTGLHFEDIQKLLNILHALVQKGNTVLVIEHNLDVLRNADWIIDLGPEGGEKGGEVVAEGTPEEIKKVKKSYTGEWLARIS
ncbi:MAG: excinuclease ABC subunit A [Parcubacteria group bacterium Gr01-1014_33]|nr:MAG: excinuclease ABC subunit A [Parcubacteria group bacterium Gr01-1014_33]